MANTNHKPVIFLAFANDRDDTVGYLRNLPDEARRLREVLESAEQAGLCEVVVRPNSTAWDIFKVFQDSRYRNRIAIFHYGGHANGDQLLLESAAGQSAVADAGGLAKFLGQQQGLQLVFLNGCSTRQQTEGLLEVNIPVVISTSRAIDDRVATDFSFQFYQGLASGASIRTAYREAEAAIQTAKGCTTRGLHFGANDDASNQPEVDRWPWNLYLREGSDTADQWNLPEAVNDPLFGLPALPERDLPESPYRHLNTFQREHAEVFFGRGHQIRELFDRLTAPQSAPIVLFYGQSGVGKSSLLDAGLMPRLERDHEVRYVRRGASGLLATLRSELLSEAADLPIETAWLAKEEQLKKPLIVFLDQVEELYTRPLADVTDELDQLLKVIKATFSDPHNRPQGKLVLSFRKEWLAELETQLAAYEIPRTKIFLATLDRRGIIEVVQGPTRSTRLRERYGLIVEEGLAEIIANDLLDDRDSALAPTLQILLTKTWAQATEANYEHPHFTQVLYQRLKRDGILLRDFLNQQIATFRQRYPHVVDSGLLLDLLAQHTTSLGTADQRSVEQLWQQYPHLGATLQDILQQCQDLHLMTVTTSAQKDFTKTTRLAHDTLAPIVREQFDQSDKPGQRARRILDSRAVDWADNMIGPPLDEADLKLVEQGADGTRIWNSTEQRLLHASGKKRKGDELYRLLRKASLIVSAAILLIAVGLGIFGWRENSRAEHEKRFRTAVETVTRGGGRVAVDASKDELTYSVLLAKETVRKVSKEEVSDIRSLIFLEADRQTGRRRGMVLGTLHHNETNDFDVAQAIHPATIRAVRAIPNVHLIVQFDIDQTLQAIEGFGNIRSLRIADSPDTRFDEASLKRLGKLPNLESLDLSHTSLGDSGAIHLVAIRGLKQIDLSGTQITDEGLTQLNVHPQLREINLRNTQVTKNGFVGFRQAKPDTKLLLDKLAVFKENMSKAFSESDLIVDDDFELVDVKVCDKVTDADMAVLRDTPRLKRVEFTSSRITDKGLSQIVGHPAIREVRFASQSGLVTDLGLGYLATLPNIQILDLGDVGSTVTDEGIEHLKDQQTLRVLRLDGRSKGRITAKIFEVLATCKNFEELEIHSIYLAGRLGQLANIPRLRFLTMQNCALTDADISMLSRAKNLERIDLCDNKELTNDCLTDFRLLPKLERLSVRNTKVTFAAFSRAGLFSNLPFIDVVDMVDYVGFNADNQPIVMFGRHFTDNECAKLSQFTTLQSVHLYNCEEVTDEGLGYLSKLPLLMQLVISPHDCTDAGLLCLTGLTNLEDLQLLHGRGITGPGVANLAKLPRLRKLTLTSLNFDGPSLQYLYGLNQLKEIRLGNAYFPEENIESLKEALPDVTINWQKPNAETLAELALVLATHPDEKMRNGKRALQHATEACRVTDFRNPKHLEALAASYAETGDFEAAKKWQKNAISMAPLIDNELYTTRLQRYESGEPCRLTLDSLKKLLLRPDEEN